MLIPSRTKYRRVHRLPHEAKISWKHRTTFW